MQLCFSHCISEVTCSTIAWRLDQANNPVKFEVNDQLEMVASCDDDYCLEGYGQQTAVNFSCNETALEEWVDTNIACVTLCK